MKSFFYLLAIVLILATAGLFVLKQPNGQPWLSFGDFSVNQQHLTNKLKTTFGAISATVGGVISDSDNVANEQEKTKVYRWKDSQGNWSYSDEPISSDSLEEVSLNPDDIMVMPAFVSPETEHKPLTTGKNKAPAASLLPVSPQKALDLYEDANNVQQLMDNRAETLQKALEKNGG